MPIKINIVDADAIKIALEARKTLDGKIMILDHLHIDIVLDTKTKTITTFPKESLSDEVYETQNAYFDKLRKDGVIIADSIEGGNVFGSLQATYPDSSNAEVSPTHVVLLSTKNFIKEELPYLQMEKEYEDEIEQEYLEPDDEESTQLGEVPEEPKKGSITPYYIRNYLGGYMNY